MVKPRKVRTEEKKFNKDMSVFRDWRADTDSTLERAGASDKEQWKAPRFIKDPEEVSILNALSSIQLG